MFPIPVTCRAARTCSVDGGWKRCSSTPCRIIRSSAPRARVTRPSSPAVARLGTTHSRARRRETSVHARKNRAFTGECSTASVKKVASCRVTTEAARLASGIV